jgi:hypothetical protein
MGPDGGRTSPNRRMSALLNGRTHAKALPPTNQVMLPWRSPSVTPGRLAAIRAASSSVALAGFLGGYRGLTRDAYALDLHQFVAFCDRCHLGLFEVRRSDIETFGRELEARGRAMATIALRLCTVTG